MFMKRLAIGMIFLVGCLMAGTGPAFAEATDITVRVLAKDAKFVGSSMGGVRIMLRDAISGEILAKGKTAGGTGDTGKVMHEKGGRRAPLADDTAAAFTATLDLAEPRLIKAEAYGPVAQPQAARRVTAEQWVLPGRDISGDGWILEMPGFVVDVLAPPAHVRLQEGAEEFLVQANVTMMCGCPVRPGGIWDSNGYEIKAAVTRDGEAIGEFDLTFAGTASQFQGTVPIKTPGLYEVTVFAFDPQTGNTGLDRTTFIVAGPAE